MALRLRRAYPGAVTRSFQGRTDAGSHGRSVPSRRAGEPLLDWIRRVDPEVALAVADVDQTLLDECLAMSPLERLRACSAAARGLARFHVAP